MRAYDTGFQSYDDRRVIHIEVLDKDDNDPVFDRTQHPTPYKLKVSEEVKGVQIGNISLAHDPDTGFNALICYFIVGEFKNEMFLLYLFILYLLI